MLGKGDTEKGGKLKLVAKYVAISLAALLLLVLALVVHTVAIITFFFSSGQFLGTSGWLVLIVFGFLLVTLSCTPCLMYFKYYLKREFSEGNEKKHLLILSCCYLTAFVFFLLFSELALAVVNPVDSIFPLSMFSEDAFGSVNHKPDLCDIVNAYEEAEAFFENCTIDLTTANLVYGGMPLHFNSARAMVIDDTIYLTSDYCPSISLLIHEIVHVWQFQQKTWFSTFGYDFWEWLASQAQCRSCPYDYGGFEGLEAAALDNKTMAFFGFEQQATIVEDYYVYLTLGQQEEDIFPYLKYFANQILQDAI